MVTFGDESVLNCNSSEDALFSTNYLQGLEQLLHVSDVYFRVSEDF